MLKAQKTILKIGFNKVQHSIHEYHTAILEGKTVHNLLFHTDFQL